MPHPSKTNIGKASKSGANRWLLCRPSHYDVKYEINSWMHVSVRPAKETAQQQWDALVATLKGLGVEILLVEPLEAQPDMVFTANAGLVRGNTVILSTFRFPERQGEAPAFRRWFEAQGYEVKELSGVAFEGEGDALFAGETLFGGVGFRSDESAYDQIASLLSLPKVVRCRLVDGHFYHLDTCFCPLTPTTALWYPPAFAPENRRMMEGELELIAIPPDEAAHFACNSVVLGDAIIMPDGTPQTRALVEARGFSVHQVPMTEFLKAGGAAKCLSLKLPLHESPA